MNYITYTRRHCQVSRTAYFYARAMASKTSPFAAPTKVGTTTRVAPIDLHTFHENPRKGDVGMIAGSLKTHGQYKPICVNVGTFTDYPNEVLAGNHTLMAFRDLAEQYPDDPRWEEILVHWVDVDSDTAARIVAVDNRASEVGSNDAQTLLNLLNGIGPDLTGTGYDSDDIAELLKLATPPAIDDAGWGDAMDGLPGGAPTVVTRTFTLTSAQAEVVDAAIEAAKANIVGEGNENGEALAWVAAKALS